MGLFRRLRISVLFSWFLLATYLYAAQKLFLLVRDKGLRVVRKIVRILRGKEKTTSKKSSLLGRIQAMQRRISARATGEMFAYFEKSEVDAVTFNYFLEDCIDSKASAQLLSSTAGMAIGLGKHEQAMQLLSQLIARYPMEVSPQQQIGVKAFILGKYTLAEEIWTQCSLHREKLIKELGLDKYKIRFLAPSWFLAIGHIAHLDIYLKHKILNGRQDHKTYYSLPVGMKMPNEELIKLWSKFISPVENDLLSRFSPAEIAILQDEFWSLDFEDGKSRMFSHAGSIVQHQWVDEGRAPLINSEDMDKARGEAELVQMGVPIGSWYVCVHVREPGFHLQWHKSHPGTRNADVMTYLPAIREVVARGGYVIRLGDSSMRPLPKEKGIVDYALSDAKSEFMDLYLCGTCKFFIGTNSGLGLVPPVFGVSCAMTNWSPVGLPQWYPSDTYIPKLIYSSELGRMMTFKEMLYSEAGWGQFEKFLTQSGLQVIDNSPEEILALVIETFNPIDLKAPNSFNYSKIEELIESAGSYKGARLSSNYILSHPEVFPEFYDGRGNSSDIVVSAPA